MYREGAPGNVPPNGYTTHIDRISAGYDANVILDRPVDPDDGQPVLL